MPPTASTPLSRQHGAVKGLGRPRSAAVRSQILAATIRLLRHQSVQEISIEGIAREAAVSKATIYRWWSSKASLVLDAFMDNHVFKTSMSPDQPPAAALALHIRSIVQEYSGWPGRVVAQIIAEGQSNPEVLREFRERFQYGRRAVVREILERLRREGVPVPANLEVLGDLLYAPIYMRLQFGHAPLDDIFVREHLGYIYSLLDIELPAELTAQVEKADRRKPSSSRS